MDEPIGNIPTTPQRTPLRLLRTLKFGIRAVWDSLGLVCAVSLTMFVAFTIPVYLGYAISRIVTVPPMLSVIGAVAFWAMAISPIFGGCCYLAAKIIDHDEPGYADLWTGFARLYVRFALLGLIQISVAAALAVNILFYLRFGSPAWLILAVVFIYLLGFWMLNCQYHFPLIVSADFGWITLETVGPARLGAAFRNALVMVMASPGYSIGLLVTLIVVTAILAISGVGMAMLGAGLIGLLTIQATRDHLVRFGLIPQQPDPGDSAPNDAWRLKDL
jgi:uncharacterized membrane protein YesL